MELFTLGIDLAKTTFHLVGCSGFNSHEVSFMEGRAMRTSQMNYGCLGATGGSRRDSVSGIGLDHQQAGAIWRYIGLLGRRTVQLAGKRKYRDRIHVWLYRGVRFLFHRCGDS
jgi:hypothetical protein